MAIPRFILATVLLAFVPASMVFAAAKPATRGPEIYSQDPEANDLFLKARELVKLSDPRSGGKLTNARAAIELFDQAVKKDPNFALAYVEMARAWMSLGYSDPDALPNSVTMPEARSDLRKALDIDPKLADAHLLAASIAYNYDFDWDMAGHDYEMALSLQPGNAAAHASYAAYLNSMGRFDESLYEIAKADAIAPSWSIDFTTARTYYSMRNFAKAEEYCQKSLAKHDNVLCHVYLGFSYIAEGNRDKALPELEIAQHFSKNFGAAAIQAYGFAMSGQRDKTEALLKRLFSGTEFGHIVSYRIAAVYLALGDNSVALNWLDRAYAEHENWINQLKVDPVIDPLRTDSRFRALMRKVGLN